MVQMFQIRTMNELHNPSEHELNLCDALLSHDYFPNSLWTMSLRACVLYHLHGDFLFRFPQRGWFMFNRLCSSRTPVWTNSRFGSIPGGWHWCGFLALDKDRPEVCCLVGLYCCKPWFFSLPWYLRILGNHYSLRAEHEKAVKYFRRATQLDRTYLCSHRSVSSSRGYVWLPLLIFQLQWRTP